MIVTVGGEIASGKTTLTKKISEQFNFKHVSAGEIMREMAHEKKMSLLEFSRYAEGNPDVDRAIDERQKELATGDCVVDGRLSAYFLKPDVSVWLTAPIQLRAKRLMEREKNKYKNMQEAVEAIKQREASEDKRYKQIYGIDISDLSVYDIVLNTGKWDIAGMTGVVATAVRLLNAGR